jgi:hypothetical protein
MMEWRRVTLYAPNHFMAEAWKLAIYVAYFLPILGMYFPLSSLVQSYIFYFVILDIFYYMYQSVYFIGLFLS